MHPTYRYAQSAFLAQIGSHSIATGTDVEVGEGIIDAATASHHGRRPKLGRANPAGEECVSTALKPNWDGKVLPSPTKKNTIKADVGILTPESKPCPGLYELCEVDETSLLGGRCTTSSRRMEISEQEKLQECTVKCPGNMICHCMYGHAGDTECKNFQLASACRSKDHSKCLKSEHATLWEVFACPSNFCADDIYEEKDDAYEVCMTCVGYKNLCEYCKENDDFFSHFVQEEVHNRCKNAPINNSYHYSQGCIDFRESLGGRFSWGGKGDGSGVGKLNNNDGTTDPLDDGNDEGTGVNNDGADAEDDYSSAGMAVVGISAATLAMVSMGIFNS
eukprot:121489_1